jgi:hypothetical protein
MKLAYKLDHQILCEKLCADIQKIIPKNENLTNKILIIDIVDITEDISLQPKLTYKELS